jgi:hypothetical protein
VERDLGIIAAADIVTGTAYTAVRFHKGFFFYLDCEVLVLVTLFVRWFFCRFCVSGTAIYVKKVMCYW